LPRNERLTAVRARMDPDGGWAVEIETEALNYVQRIER
jgi:hypothetical protein